MSEKRDHTRSPTPEDDDRKPHSSPSNEPPRPGCPRPALSRRGFLTGLALGAGASAAAAIPAEGVLGQALDARPEEPTEVGPGPVAVRLRVNGKDLDLSVEPRVTLLDALRDHALIDKPEKADLTGTKRVCDRSSCGACTVIADGRAVYACSMLAIEAQGKEIQTIEGLAKGDDLDALQRAFIRCDALMCGFCTPGFVLAAKALLDDAPNATREEIQRGLDGNICRCGAQNRIVEAVLLAASKKGGR